MSGWELTKRRSAPLCGPYGSGGFHFALLLSLLWLLILFFTLGTPFPRELKNCLSNTKMGNMALGRYTCGVQWLIVLDGSPWPTGVGKIWGVDKTHLLTYDSPGGSTDHRWLRSLATGWFGVLLWKQKAAYQIEMYESTPVVTVELEPTIRLPPCADCYIQLQIVSHVGLTLDSCSLRFTARSALWLRVAQWLSG